MKNVLIIYYSKTGNVQKMAEAIAEGVEAHGGRVIIKRVNEARVNDVTHADMVFMGCPSMTGNKIDETEMEPFVKQFKQIDAKMKKLILFGSFGWDDGEFMQKWKDRMIRYQFDLIDTLVVKEEASKSELDKCRELGKRVLEFC